MENLLALLLAIPVCTLFLALAMLAMWTLWTFSRALPLISRYFLLWLEWKLNLSLFLIFGMQKMLDEELAQLHKFSKQLTQELTDYDRRAKRT